MVENRTYLKIIWMGHLVNLLMEQGIVDMKKILEIF